MTHIPLTGAALLMVLASCSDPDGSSSAHAEKVDSSGPANVAASSSDTVRRKAAPANSAAASPQATAPRLALDPDGLRWFLQPSGSSRPLPFGTAQAEVLASLEKERGPASRGTNTDCGMGPVLVAGWPDGLSLLFQDGRFVGWGLDNRSNGGVSTADGIGIGSSRAELDDAIGPPLQVRISTLGTEFSAGGYQGLLESGRPDARITDMWAGVSCVAR